MGDVSEAQCALAMTSPEQQLELLFQDIPRVEGSDRMLNSGGPVTHLHKSI